MEHPHWFVDFEASGIAPDSYPIEIAVVSADGDYQALIQPVYYWTHWSFDAQDMHGISRESLLAGGLDPSIIAAELNARLEGVKLCSDSPKIASGSTRFTKRRALNRHFPCSRWRASSAVQLPMRSTD